MAKLTPQDIAQLSGDLPDWKSDGKTLSRDFTFKDFKAAFAFMTEIAAEADRADHHPDWSNVYNKVSIRLSTHDAGGLTDKDVNLAHFIDAAARKRQAQAAHA
jgi:4a-hydroxytetrahydrobiopterin dehydratase